MPLYDCGDPDCLECKRAFRSANSETRARLTDADLVAMDAWSLPESERRKLGALLTEIREWRALLDFAEERASYPMATWGEQKLASLMLRIAARTASATTMAPVHEIFEGILKVMSGEAK